MIRYGDITVPQPVMWSGEAEYFVGRCRWFGRPAICQKEAQGSGVPMFGRPHVMRQRKLMATVCCDVCGKSMRHSTKISLSNFGDDISEDCVLTEVEPLLHVECARLSMSQCPALRRQLAEGRLRVRQVFRCAPRATAATAEEKANFVPGYGEELLLGLAVMDITSWRDVTSHWM